jgi:chlorophyll synthase
MALPQVVVVAMLLQQGKPVHAAIVSAVLLAQIALMPMLVKNPRKRAPLYNATGTTLYVSGMMTSAFAMRALLSVAA